VDRLVAAVPSGSYLVVNDGTDTSDEIAAGARVSGEGGHQYTLRRPDQIAAFFTGLELEAPGVVPTTAWRPDTVASAGTSAQLDGYCGVGRKP
jgi:S-adenosyl methyltransferase